MPEDAAVVGEASSGPAGESLSCVTCRSRKLKCDKAKPACTRCTKVNGDCVYPESRRKPAFKRKNVKELEERLAQVEGLLRQVGGSGLIAAAAGVASDAEDPTAGSIDVDPFETPVTEEDLLQDIDYGNTPGIHLNDSAFTFNNQDPTTFSTNASSQSSRTWNGNTPTGELIDLGGVFEALPPFEVMEELNRLFFERPQHFAPIIHPGRYLQAFYSAPHMKPPMCLQYAIWAITANGDPKYHTYHDVFYQRARNYAETDEMKGIGEHFITIAHAQTWCVLASDEAKSMMFTRAAMSSARAIRLTSMMGLHHLDTPPDESSPTLLPPKDWAELEERRRVFWGVFCIDSHCSISTGWPHLIDLTNVTTHLPSSEAAFHSGKPMETCTIHEVFKGDHSYSSFSGTVIVCHLFNIILKHAHRPKDNDNPENYEYGEYWKRHREIDNTLSSAFMLLPESFRLPENYSDRTAVNTNLNLHAAIICLHLQALERIETYKLPDFAKRISLERLSAAAQEIVNIVKLTSHMSLGSRTPLVALSLYCAASVFMHYCMEAYTPTNAENLDFILSTMAAIGRTHFITRAFLRQALLDIEQNGVHDIVDLPHARRLSRNLSPSLNPYIPLLARTRLSRHSKAQPPLPCLPIGKAMRRNVPLPSGTWSQNTGPSALSSGSDDHPHKRQRTEAASSSASSLFTNAGASNGFSYLPLRSEGPPASSYPTSTPNIPPNTESPNSNTIDTNQTQIGVTIASGILGHRGPKPFTTAGRDASQTMVSKGGMGSWELGGMCLSAMADHGGTPADDNVAAQFANSGDDLGINWDVLGVGATDTQGGNIVDSGEPDVG
ncbi:hypothetical protein F5B22DRAFT_299953 [Xylaria bambusicola]|uniref:uncharacterized protein n=1 Tax=Xylaria bambusicola TaxID=326684 RepID=UPI00200893DF|nr:uncharacterized protein F5B22DRAFT_299953 [Xylaria bambusicola]KAI0512638.1 hypothetical protein F5B22DRAFT_299953 [Xylaria bambusicola]